MHATASREESRNGSKVFPCRDKKTGEATNLVAGHCIEKGIMQACSLFANHRNIGCTPFMGRSPHPRMVSDRPPSRSQPITGFTRDVSATMVGCFIAHLPLPLLSNQLNEPVQSPGSKPGGQGVPAPQHTTHSP